MEGTPRKRVWSLLDGRNCSCSRPRLVLDGLYLELTATDRRDREAASRAAEIEPETKCSEERCLRDYTPPSKRTAAKYPRPSSETAAGGRGGGASPAAVLWASEVPPLIDAYRWLMTYRHTLPGWCCPATCCIRPTRRRSTSL